ncbi:hypothetical protein GGR50DRAFT_694402 [Xylaria sp. CBS 124048]|nr:hypothetical protein GGR50DRAFT_694402 [Xylaria sp. CBS 124048]
MSTTSSSSGSRPNSRNYDTGFPDWFASRTTSLRHPDAIVDPSFAISSEHIDPAKTQHRSLMSLLRKHRRAMSSGKSSEGHLSRVSVDYASEFAVTDSSADISHHSSHDPVATTLHRSSADSDRLIHMDLSKKISGVIPLFEHSDDGDLNDGTARRRTNIFRKLMSKN